jgi:hypothetical protein
LVPTSAAASEVFPAAMQEAAGMPCAPSCVLCHGKTPGDATSFFVRKFPQDVFQPANGGLPKAGPDGVPTVKSDFATYASKQATDPEIARVVAALKDGIDPQTGDDLCGPVYGCGASTIAKKAPPQDLSAPLWIVGAVAVAGLLRRRKRAAT